MVCKKLLLPVLLLVFIHSAALAAELWYESNASAQAFRAISAASAKRLQWSLSVRKYSIDALREEQEEVVDSQFLSADFMEQASNPEYRLERTQHWRSGELLSTVYLILDARGGVLLRERFSQNEHSREHLNARGELLDYWTFSDTDDARLSQYVYERGQLSKIYTYSQTDVQDESTRSLLWEDTYRYLRTGSLRSVQRKWPEKEAVAVSQFALRVGIPRRIVLRSEDGRYLVKEYDALGRDILDQTSDESGALVEAASSREYDDSGSYSVIERTADGSLAVVNRYSAENRLLETIRYGAENKELERLVQTWDGERLLSGELRLGEQLRRIDYSYSDSGVLQEERTYLDEQLERVVRYENDRKVEELYIDGELALRAQWSGLRKLSEETFPLLNGDR